MFSNQPEKKKSPEALVKNPDPFFYLRTTESKSPGSAFHKFPFPDNSKDVATLGKNNLYGNDFSSKY